LIPIGGKLPVHLWELPVKPRTSAIRVYSVEKLLLRRGRTADSV